MRQEDGIYYFEVAVSGGWSSIAVSAIEAHYSRLADAALIDDADDEARARYLAEYKAGMLTA